MRCRQSLGGEIQPENHCDSERFVVLHRAGSPQISRIVVGHFSPLLLVCAGKQLQFATVLHGEPWVIEVASPTFSFIFGL